MNMAFERYYAANVILYVGEGYDAWVEVATIVGMSAGFKADEILRAACDTGSAILG
jgi:hypothetical protein